MNEALNFGQCFVRGQRVKIDDKLPSFMSHFEAGCEAIVDHSYRDMYGHGGSEQYSLMLLRDGKGYNRVSWYMKELLTLVSTDRDAGEILLQEYNARR